MTLIDTKSWQIYKQVNLPNSDSYHFNIDPFGRIWIGYAGDFYRSDDRVQIYTKSGEIVDELTPCDAPNAGIHFTSQRVFIACTLNGFHGKVVVIDLLDMSTEADIDFRLPDNHLLFTTSATSEDTLLMSAYTGIPRDQLNAKDTSYTRVALLDEHNLVARLLPTIFTDVRIIHIIPYDGKFYLLNTASWRQSRSNAQDILIIDPTIPDAIGTLTFVSSPTIGVIHNNILYAYHNPEYGQAHSDPKRLFSRTDLTTGVSQTWDLPDRWNAGDMVLIDGEIMMSGYYWGAEDRQDALYRFDMETGELSTILPLDSGNAKLLYITE